MAERRNRTLVSTARCLPIQSGLSPSPFWAEAVNCVNYIRNRYPTSCLNGNTQFEAWNVYKPHISNLKVFGSKVLCLKREPGKTKFESRCKKVFLWVIKNRQKDTGFGYFIKKLK